MASYRGTCRVKTSAGKVVLDHATVSISDDPARCTYRSRPPWCGELSQGDANLMREPFRSDPECVLEFDSGDVARARINSWDRGGQRAQLIGYDTWPITQSQDGNVAVDEARLGGNVDVDAVRDPPESQAPGSASRRA
jgi:hypothetical protein